MDIIPAMRSAKTGGRRSKLTPELQNKICQVIRAGNYQEVACAYVGIAKETYYNWLEKGEKPGATGMYRDFHDAVQKALADAEVANVTLIQKAAQGGALVKETTKTVTRRYTDPEKKIPIIETETTTERSYATSQWQAAAWTLERSHHKRWGRKPVEVTGADGGPIQIQAFDYGATMAALPAPQDGTIIDSTAREVDDSDAIRILESDD